MGANASHGQPDTLIVVTPAYDAAVADRNTPGVGAIHRRSAPPAGYIADMAEIIIGIAVSAGERGEAGCIVSVPIVMGFHSDGRSIFAPQKAGKRRPLGLGWYMP